MREWPVGSLFSPVRREWVRPLPISARAWVPSG